MRFTGSAVTSSLLLSAFASVSLFASTVSAQSSSTSASLPNLSDTQASSTGTTSKSSSTTSNSQVVITPTGSGSSSTGSDSIPVITGSGSSAASLTGLPKITGAYTIVPASVPPTADAPFMQISKLPEGTVFIIVGAILGFFGVSVLLWRSLVAWSLHRSVKRANMQQYMSADAKANFRAPPAPFYKYSDRDSTIDLAGIGKGGKKGGRPPTGSAPSASASTLFFSPTAGAVNNPPGNRGSHYLPAGYYAAGAGAGAPGGGNGPYQSNINMSDLGPRPQSQGYYRPMSPSSPVNQPHQTNAGSSSSLNLNSAPGEQRAPSLYLNDLFDGSNVPPPLPPHHGHYQGSGRPF